jgi:hypothetical protein
MSLRTGDGNTVGKLHFDAFDNILVQLIGTKLAINDRSSRVNPFHLLPIGSKSFRMIDPGRYVCTYVGCSGNLDFQSIMFVQERAALRGAYA